MTTNLISTVLVTLAAGAVEINAAQTAVMALIGDNADKNIVGIILAGVKSGVVVPADATVQLESLATPVNKGAGINGADNAIIISGNTGTINIGAMVPITKTTAPVTADESTTPAAKKAEKKPLLMTAEESNKAAEDSDHVLVVAFPPRVSNGTAIYRLDNEDPVKFNFNGQKEISDRVLTDIAGVAGTIACNNKFVADANENVTLATNVKGSKMYSAYKQLADMLAAADNGIGNSQQAAVKAPKGAKRPPMGGLAKKAAAKKATAKKATANGGVIDMTDNGNATDNGGKKATAAVA